MANTQLTDNNGHAARHTATLAECDAGLAPVREYVKAHGLSPLVKKLTTLTGTTMKKQQVERWVTMNGSRRVEPGFGMGRLLVKAVDELQLQPKSNHE